MGRFNLIRDEIIKSNYVEDLERLNEIENAKEFSKLRIIVKWTKSKMWGYTARVMTDGGYNGKCISGCGYDKYSTAIAEGLNSSFPLLKLLCQNEEVRLKKGIPRIEFFGDGLSSGAIPYFSDFVRIEDIKGVLRKVGLKLEEVYRDSSIDIIEVSE